MFVIFFVKSIIIW